MTVTPTAADANATITVNGNPVASGTPSGSIAQWLPWPERWSITVVAAQDETLIHAPATIKTYTVTVTRAASSNADLSDLTATAGPLSPAVRFQHARLHGQYAVHDYEHDSNTYCLRCGSDHNS